jgi:Leucine-rich repeat (LRR) protein
LKEDRLQDVDFLREYDFLEALDINSLDDYDFSFLSTLKKLTKLSIYVEGKNTIDLSNQTNLKSLAIGWRKGITGIEFCQKLENICLVDYKKTDLSPIETLKNLKEIVIKTASIKNLSGLKGMKSLHRLLLGNCRSLRSISEINGLNSLKSLEIISCSKIMDYQSLTNLPNLETLHIIDCRDLESIRFVKKLPALMELALNGNTNVLDGDMKPALGIRKVICAHRKHYNMKVGE